MNTYRKGRGAWPLLRLTALGAGLMVALTACDVDKIMEIDDPEFPGEGQVPIPAVAGGATAEFQRAYSGASGFLHNEGYLTVSAALGDEFRAAGTFTTRIAIDERSPQPAAQGNISDWAYRYLHRARRSAGDALDVLEADGVTSGAIVSRLYAIEGYSIMALGEGFCGAVPISTVEGGVFQHGPMFSTTQLFERAIQSFDAALGASAGNHMAAVGKGRALVNLGRFADAAAAVAGVPTTFGYFFEHSDNDGWQRNNVWSLQNNGRWTVSDLEGGNGMPYRSSGDPRVPWFGPRAGGGFDPAVALFISQRYAVTGETSVNNSANVVLADGVEARLIEAEAALHGGGDWLGILNALRADFEGLMSARYFNYEANLDAGVDAGRLDATLPPLTDPGTPAARVDMLFYERAMWLHLTGHRLGDMRRLARAPYSRAVNDIFPVGQHHLGATYGSAVNFPIPQEEENNENYDPAQCVITQP
jgi:starch-binding outer membrane protein, SusD/RagB family